MPHLVASSVCGRHVPMFVSMQRFCYYAKSEQKHAVLLAYLPECKQMKSDIPVRGLVVFENRCKFEQSTSIRSRSFWKHDNWSASTLGCIRSNLFQTAQFCAVGCQFGHAGTKPQCTPKTNALHILVFGCIWIDAGEYGIVPKRKHLYKLKHLFQVSTFADFRTYRHARYKTSMYEIQFATMISPERTLDNFFLLPLAFLMPRIWNVWER